MAFVSNEMIPTITFFATYVIIISSRALSGLKCGVSQNETNERNTVSKPNLLYITAVRHINIVTIPYAINVFQLQPLSE